MNAAGWWLSLDQAGYRLAWVLLSVLWQSSILLLAAAGLAWLLRRRPAALRHALWVTAILLSPLAPLLGWMAGRSGTPQAQIPIVPAYSSPVYSSPSAVQAEAALAALPEAAHQAIPVQEDSQAGSAVAAAAPAPTAIQAQRPAQPPSPAQGRLSLLAFGWAWALLAYAAGAAALLCLVAVGKFRIARWVRQGRPVTDARVLSFFQAACERLGLSRHVAIVENARIHSPVTVGTLRSVVILPAALAVEMSDKELTAIALHELAHARRHDSALLGLLSVVRAVLFFHPLVWLACRQASVLAESACDEVVLEATGEPVGYAKMLTRLAEQLPRRPLGTGLAAGFILPKSAFLRRIEAILSNRPEGLRRLSRLGLTATLLTALAALALALALPLGQKAQAQVASRPAAATQPADAAVKSVRVVPLKFASAPDVVNVIRGQFQHLVISPDVRSNSLVLSGPQQDLAAATVLIAELDKLIAELDKAPTAVEGRRGSGPAPAERIEPLPARFQAVVYQVSVPTNRIAELDAQAMSGRAKTAAEFQKHLEGLVAKGSPKVLYAVDQVLDLSSNSKITMGANEPVVTGTSGSSSKPAVMVSYQSLGGIFTIGGASGGDNKLRIRLSIELSALSDSTVQLSNDVRATTLRRATIQHNGPVEQGKPFVAISVDAAGEQGGSATAFICRAVVEEAK